MPVPGKHIGLFFGSFNPVHTGHLIIANHLATRTDLAEVWLVVSPQNPFKKKASLAPDYDRLHLVELATADNPLLRPCDIEFRLPRPSYTVDTLAYLAEKYPHHQFALIMGGDNLVSLHKWKNFEHLLTGYRIFVYQRPTYTPAAEWVDHPNIYYIKDVPLMQLSASFIRDALRQGFPIRYLVPDPVLEYLEKTNLYR